MLHSQLHTLLSKELPAINDKLKAINSGGCGLFALVLHRELKRQCVHSQIVLVNQGYDEMSVERLIERHEAKGINSAYQSMFKGVDPKFGHVIGNALNGHIAVQIRGVLYDASGHLAGNNKAISEHLTVKTMEQFLRIDDCWNFTFRRKNYRNKDIIGTFEKFFSNMFAVAS